MKVTQKISALFLSVIVLVFSLGITINRMVCLKSGIAQVSLGNIKDCCEKSNNRQPSENNDYCCSKGSKAFHLNETHCCNLSSTFFHLNDYSPSEKHTLPGAIDFTLPVCSSTNTSVIEHTEKGKLIFCSADLPPPLHGKQLLSFISVFII
ncbi:MAG: hypothetical protein WAQ28_07700 [Bacteroidia bacterium]|jgi:hypothetical protein